MRGNGVSELGDAFAGHIEACPRDGGGLCRGSRTSCKRRHAAEQAAHVLRTAFAEEGEQPVKLVARQRRGFDEALVDCPALAGQKRQRDALVARQGRQPVAAIAPPVVAAEDADQDDLGMGGDAVDPEIDGHRMPEIGERGEPHRKASGRAGSPGIAKAGEIAVGKGQGDQVRGLLAQVDGLGEIVDRG